MIRKVFEAGLAANNGTSTVLSVQVYSLNFGLVWPYHHVTLKTFKRSRRGMPTDYYNHFSPWNPPPLIFQDF